MKSTQLLAGLLAILVLACAAGCSSTTTIRVPVAPRVDLGQYPTIGLVKFASNDSDTELRRQCTQQFLQAMQAAQPGTKVLELGDESRVLASVNRQKWDARTLQAVREKHGIDAVIIGRLDMQKDAPDIRLSTVWKSLSVKSDVTGSLTAKLLETQTGATTWTDSAQMTVNVARAKLNGRGEGALDASDPKVAMADMLSCLVRSVTDDFRVHYVTKRVPKEQLQAGSVASAE